MALRDYRAATRTIRFERASGDPLAFCVRGLTLGDLSFLVNTHFPDLAEVVDLYVEANGATFGLDAMQTFMLRVIGRAPVLAANIIAVCTEDEESDTATLAEIAMRLPAPVQFKALSEILQLTTEDVGGPKAALALLGEVISGSLPEEMRQRVAARATTT